MGPLRANFLTALAATVVFKVALFAYSASGAEGAESALLTWPRLALCFGWDVLSACVVAAVAAAVAVPLGRRLPRVAFAWSILVQAIYGLFLIVSFNVALIVGAPLDKAAIDLLFLYNATPGGTSRLMADSIAPYVTPTFGVEAVACLALPPIMLFNELFDVAHDPDERVDLSGRQPALTSTPEALSRRWQDHSRYLIENYAAVLASSGRRCASPISAPAATR